MARQTSAAGLLWQMYVSYILFPVGEKEVELYVEPMSFSIFPSGATRLHQIVYMCISVQYVRELTYTTSFSHRPLK